MCLNGEMIYVSSFLPLPSFSLLIQQSGHLDVVVPPDILNSPEISADESVTNEGGNVQLMCQATGVPEPRLVSTITWCFNLPHSLLIRMKINDIFDAVLFFIFSFSVQWRREDGKDIVVRNEGRERQRNELNYFNIMAIQLSFCF